MQKKQQNKTKKKNKTKQKERKEKTEQVRCKYRKYPNLVRTFI